MSGGASGAGASGGKGGGASAPFDPNFSCSLLSVCVVPPPMTHLFCCFLYADWHVGELVHSPPPAALHCPCGAE